LRRGGGSNPGRRAEVDLVALEQGFALAACVACGVLGLESGAQADQRDFPFTYEWRQAGKGEKEFEVKSFYSGSALVQEFEAEYGISNRLAIAPYVVFEKESGGKYRYHEFKLEGRYQLGKYKRNKFLPGLYAEYARERGGDDDAEGKLILSRYGDDGSNLSINLTTERSLARGAEFERGYSVGYARDIGRSGLRGGGELIHNLSDKLINLGPVASYRFGDGLYVTGGYAFALNKRRANHDQVRLNFEYEF